MLIDNPKKYFPIYNENHILIRYEYEKLILDEFECFGENSIINRRPRNASAVAIGNVELMLLREEGFKLCFGVKYNIVINFT